MFANYLLDSSFCAGLPGYVVAMHVQAYNGLRVCGCTLWGTPNLWVTVGKCAFMYVVPSQLSTRRLSMSAAVRHQRISAQHQRHVSKTFGGLRQSPASHGPCRPMEFWAPALRRKGCADCNAGPCYAHDGQGGLGPWSGFTVSRPQQSRAVGVKRTPKMLGPAKDFLVHPE